MDILHIWHFKIFVAKSKNIWQGYAILNYSHLGYPCHIYGIWHHNFFQVGYLSLAYDECVKDASVNGYGFPDVAFKFICRLVQYNNAYIVVIHEKHCDIWWNPRNTCVIVYHMLCSIWQYLQTSETISSISHYYTQIFHLIFSVSFPVNISCFVSWYIFWCFTMFYIVFTIQFLWNILCYGNEESSLCSQSLAPRISSSNVQRESTHARQWLSQCFLRALFRTAIEQRLLVALLAMPALTTSSARSQRTATKRCGRRCCIAVADACETRTIGKSS